MPPKNVCSNPSHADRPGAMYCAKCEKFYCAECEAGIHTIFFSDHADFITRDIDDTDNIFTGKCEKHKGYPLDYFCQDHKRLCCARCKEDGEKHAKCTTTLFETLDAEEIKRDFSDAVEDLRLRISRSEDFSGVELERRATEMEQNVIRVKEAITATCKMLHEAIDKREIELLQEVEKIYGKEDLSELINKLRNTDEAKALLKQGKKILENQKQPKEMLDRTRKISKMANALEKIEGKIVGSMCVTDKLDVSFPYEALVQEIQSFGEVKYSKSKFVPELTVESTTHNSISGTCTRAPFSNALYQVAIVNTKSAEANIAYSGEDTYFNIEGLTPETEYRVFVRIKVDGLIGGYSKGVSVKTGQDPMKLFSYEYVNYGNNSTVEAGQDLMDVLEPANENLGSASGRSGGLIKNSHWKRMEASGTNSARYSVDESNPNIAKKVIS